MSAPTEKAKKTVSDLSKILTPEVRANLVAFVAQAKASFKGTPSEALASKVDANVMEGIGPFLTALDGVLSSLPKAGAALGTGVEQYHKIEELLRDIGAAPAEPQEKAPLGAPAAVIESDIGVKGGRMPKGIPEFIATEWKKINPKPGEVKGEKYYPSEEEWNASIAIAELVRTRYHRYLNPRATYSNGRYPGQKYKRDFRNEFIRAENMFGKKPERTEKKEEAQHPKGPRKRPGEGIEQAVSSLPVQPVHVIPENQRVYLAKDSVPDCYVTDVYVRSIVAHLKGALYESIVIEDTTLMSVLNGSFRLKTDQPDLLKPVRDSLIEELNRRGLKARFVDKEGIVVSAS